jgi:hypothetical protein
MLSGTMELEPPYRETLEGILSFSTFAAAEESLMRLENLCRKYQAASDKKGVDYCRKIALLGRQRAERISRDKRVNPVKRLQKREIANWFRIWLETPAIFIPWLALRKNTTEFLDLMQYESLDEPKSREPHAQGN